MRFPDPKPRPENWGTQQISILGYTTYNSGFGLHAGAIQPSSPNSKADHAWAGKGGNDTVFGDNIGRPGWLGLPVPEGECE